MLLDFYVSYTTNVASSRNYDSDNDILMQKDMTKKLIDELAKTLPVIEESFQMSYVGGGDGTSASPYTQVEFDSMCSSDNWNGGYVEGMGYVANDVYVYGNSTYPGQTSQNYYTFPEYVTSVSMNGANQVAGAIISEIPILGTAISYYAQEVGDMTRDIQSELLRKGYDGSSSFTIVRTSMGNSIRYSVYDANNGGLITSRTINTAGSWK